MLLKQLLVSLVAGFFVWTSTNACIHTLAPSPNLTEWWGPAELQGQTNTSIRPFTIQFTDEMVADLKHRLARHRSFVHPIGSGFNYGFNTSYLPEVLDYWQNQYDFPSRQNFLNQFPQYKTNIQGLDIHFIRVQPNVGVLTRVVPILLLHGWPGSVREFYEIIPLLTRRPIGRDFAFEVIVPSLPGFGFSDAAARPGLGATNIAVIMRNLMQRLDHSSYYIQGGDWGSIVTANMATLFPTEVLGYHTNMGSVRTICSVIMSLGDIFDPTEILNGGSILDMINKLPREVLNTLYETGFFHIQATRPDTVGVGITDSPAGLAAYILEKFSTLTNPNYMALPDGGLTIKFSMDQLLDNIMMYWASNSIGTSVRIYYEELSAGNRQFGYGQVPTLVPTWVVQAKYETGLQSDLILRTKYINLLHITSLDDGGHFLALEYPSTLADDLFSAVAAFRLFHPLN